MITKLIQDPGEPENDYSPKPCKEPRQGHHFLRVRSQNSQSTIYAQYRQIHSIHQFCIVTATS
jgi:hypothetical protein